MSPIQTYLSRLLSSSRHVIVNGQVGQLTELQNYLHVPRRAEKQLAELLDSSKPGSSKLILLCGNVGDGKSHLLSHLRTTNRLYEFQVHNDATESFDPSKTNLETLVENVLTEFSDDQIESSSKRLVLAINLGVLANLYDKITEVEYSRLRGYIEDSGLLDRIPSSQSTSDYFAHVDYTASPVVEFGEDEISAPLFRKLLDRIFSKESDNPFYSAYKKSPEDDIAAINYGFLLDTSARKSFESLLIQAVVKRKLVFSIREFLDFLAICLLGRGGAMSGCIMHRIFDFLPFSIFEKKGSPLLDAYRKSDPVSVRSARADAAMFEIAAANSQDRMLNIAFNYDVPSWLPILEEDSDIDLRGLCKLQQRLDFFTATSDREKEDKCYSEYLRVFSSVSKFKSGNSPDSTLSKFIETVNNAVSCWHGDPHKPKHIVLRPPGPRDRYRLLRQFELRVSGRHDEIELTNHDFAIQFQINGSQITRTLNVDFELYQMVFKVSQGYLPNRFDQLACVSLSAFVGHIINTGINDADIFVDRINQGGAIEFVATNSGLGLQFSRVS